jgi:hypothetical protein
MRQRIDLRCLGSLQAHVLSCRVRDDECCKMRLRLALGCRVYGCPSPALVTPHLAFHPHILAAFGTNTRPAPMRYIRFLKTPRVVVDKKTAKSEVHCLITIASDLGDSFLPYDVQLSAELYACTKDPADDPEVTRYKTGDVLVWGSVQWTGGMRSLSITLPLRKSQASSFQLRVGVEPRKVHDDYASLSEPGARGVVSAWSAAFASQAEAPKLVERRFVLPTGKSINVWEETGESIARHLW